MSPLPESSGNEPAQREEPSRTQFQPASYTRTFLQLILLVALASAGARWLFLALTALGLPLSAATGEIVQLALTATLLAVTIGHFLVSPTIKRLRARDADARQLRLDRQDTQRLLTETETESARARAALANEAALRQRFEQEVSQLSQEMERRVAERTAELERQKGELRAELGRQQRAAGALRESERQYRHLVELADEGIWTLDAQGQTSFVNQHGAELLGYAVAEMLGHPSEDFIHVEDLPPEIRGFDLRRGSSPDSMQFRMRHKRGHDLWARASASCMIGEEGDYLGALILFEDVSDEKAQEARQLREQRLDSASTMAHGLAQELSNSLAAVLLSAQTLRPRVAPEDQELIATLKTSAERGAELLSEILTFARGIEGERQVLQPSQLLKETIDTLREVFPRTVEIITESEDRIANIAGDPMQLRQLLLRLCVYARDAMPSGGTLRLRAGNVRVDDPIISARLGIRPGPYVVLQIEDSGAPIPPALQDRVFEPFFSARERRTGTGMSLSAALAVAKSHGGTIEVKSPPGAGSSLHIYLPALTVEDGGRDSGVQAAARSTVERSEFVLVVERDRGLRETTKLALTRSGYAVLAAGNGPDALGLMSQNPGKVRVLLTDLGMPGVDAPALTRVARDLNPRVRIIASTAFGRSLGQTQKLAALQTVGIHRLLPRPCTLEELLEAIRVEIEKSGSAAS